MNNQLTARLARPLSRALSSRSAVMPSRLSIAESAIDGRASNMGTGGSSPNKKSGFKFFSRRDSKSGVERARTPSIVARNPLHEKLLAAGYTAEELQDYHQVFSLFDTDDSGSIGTTELANAMRSMGMNPGQQELESLINEVDADGNGEIDFEEFCGVMKRMYRKKIGWDDIVKQCFTVFDRNGAGTITDLEFQYVLRSIGGINDDQVIDGIFSEFDVDGNGLIDYDEFTNMVKSYMTEEDVESLQQSTMEQVRDFDRQFSMSAGGWRQRSSEIGGRAIARPETSSPPDKTGNQSFSVVEEKTKPRE